MRDIGARRARDPGATYDVNEFSDLSEDEFVAHWTSGHAPWAEVVAAHRVQRRAVEAVEEEAMAEVAMASVLSAARPIG